MTETQNNHQLYLKLLTNFCKENNLDVIEKYKDSLKFEVKNSTLTSNYSINNNVFNINNLTPISLANIDFNNYENQLIFYFIHNSNDEERKFILLNKNEFFYSHSLVENLIEKNSYLNIVIQGIASTNFWNDLTSKYVVQKLIKHKNNINYDMLIDLLLTNQFKEIKKPKNKIFVNLMLEHVTDDIIYNKYNNMIPNNEFSDNIFADLKINCFDLIINKEKLHSFIILSDKSDYDSMHNQLLSDLNSDYFNKNLGIYSIEGESKFKSSKYYRYIIRLKEDSHFNKEDIQLFFISYLKMYSNLLNNKGDNHKWDVVKTISPEMIMNDYLNYKLSKQPHSRTPSLKNKI